MKNNSNAVTVVCPFYKAKGRTKDNQVIYCEGAVTNSSIHLAFATPEQRQQYMHQHCNKFQGHKECLIAKALYEKWK